ncbi:MAG TPA: hypothetical protein VIK37_02195 [Candidatus Saccharimonadales bacterium]
MTGINHAITGALVAVVIKEPALALPAALLSHFVIDAIPHYDHRDLMPNPRAYKTVLVLDAILSVGLIVFLALTLNESAWLIIAGGFLGIAPDLMWLPAIAQGRVAPRNKGNFLHQVRRFHAWIQWSEGPRGLYVEIAWFGLVFILIWNVGR